MTAASFEAKQIVRTFSEEAEWRMTNTNNHTELADVIKDRIAQEEASDERSNLEAYYKPRPVSDDKDVARLDVEGNKLRKALEGFQAVLPPEERCQLRADGFDEVQALVGRIEESWQAKKKKGIGGTTKTYLRRMCGTLSSHSTMLKLIPEGSEYVSIFSGTLQVLLSASANYERITAGLSQALVTIGESVEACLRECRLYPTASMQRRICDLYAHVFLFLTDTVTWYTSKSRRRLLNSFKENFYDQFADQIKNIESFSQAIRREAATGTAAQTKVIGMDVESLKESVEDLRQDIRLGLEGMARREAEQRHREEELQRAIELEVAENRQLQIEAAERLEMACRHIGELALRQLLQQAQTMIDGRQQSQIAFDGREQTRGLVVERQQPQGPIYGRQHAENMIAGRQSTDQGPSGSVFLRFAAAMPTENVASSPRALAALEPTPGITRDAIALSSANLEDFFHRNRVRLDMPNDVYVNQRVVSSLQEWMRSTGRLLCIVGPFQRSESAMTSQLASKFIESCCTSDIPVISYFCRLQSGKTRPTLNAESEALIGMAYALIRQAVEYLPVDLQGGNDPNMDQQRFSRLDGTLDTWGDAMALLSDLLHLGPPVQVMVVDGMQWLEDRTTRDAITRFLGMLRECRVSGRLKVLLTTAGKSRAILQNLKERTETVFADDNPAGRPPGSPAPGRAKFMPSV